MVYLLGDFTGNHRKGKPVVRQGRKATGSDSTDSLAAEMKTIGSSFVLKPVRSISASQRPRQRGRQFEQFSDRYSRSKSRQVILYMAFGIMVNSLSRSTFFHTARLGEGFSFTNYPKAKKQNGFSLFCQAGLLGLNYYLCRLSEVHK
jgi:hypothetical protein